MFDRWAHFNWGIILFAVVYSGILLVSLLRLDTLLATPRKLVKHRRNGIRLNRDGEALLCDPDGHIWRPSGNRP